MQDLSKLPPVLSKPISDKGIESVLASAVEAHPLPTVLAMLAFLAFIAWLVYCLARHLISNYFNDSADARSFRARVLKIEHETKRLMKQQPKKRKQPAKRR